LYRLPTEAEWEYACRNGATSEAECSHCFYFEKPTNDLSSFQANFDGNFPFGRGEKGPSLGRPTRVGAYPSNKLGLCDMHGNVWQWCADILNDPKAQLKGDSFRVFRGGAFHFKAAYCQAAARDDRGEPEGRGDLLGLRLARVPLALNGR
jgi:formylglycine-generating enzyme required for sulfatase activity